MAERYGLFIIIVLGEVVLGVVDGLLAVEDLDFRTVATGVLGLSIAFGFWWTYFDYVGRRLPRQDAGSLALWLYSQLPIALAVAAAGAGMVSLIEHAADARTPEPSSWLLAGSVSALLIALVATIATLADYRRLAGLYRPLAVALLLGAAAALAIGWARPAPWLLATLLDLILIAIWSFAFARTLRTPATRPNPAREVISSGAIGSALVPGRRGDETEANLSSGIARYVVSILSSVGLFRRRGSARLGPARSWKTIGRKVRAAETQPGDQRSRRRGLRHRRRARAPRELRQEYRGDTPAFGFASADSGARAPPSRLRPRWL